ncbi:MAG: hypothetical protein AAF653_08435 [Chloroflexota bacterium]
MGIPISTERDLPPAVKAARAELEQTNKNYRLAAQRQLDEYLHQIQVRQNLAVIVDDDVVQYDADAFWQHVPVEFASTASLTITLEVPADLTLPDEIAVDLLAVGFYGRDKAVFELHESQSMLDSKIRIGRDLYDDAEKGTVNMPRVMALRVNADGDVDMGRYYVLPVQIGEKIRERTVDEQRIVHVRGYATGTASPQELDYLVGDDDQPRPITKHVNIFELIPSDRIESRL